MLIELFLIYVLSGGAETAPKEPILIPVAAEDLARCRLTLEQVLAGPLTDEAEAGPALALAAQPVREVRCVLATE